MFGNGSSSRRSLPPHRLQEHTNIGEVTELPTQGVLPSFVQNSHPCWGLLINLLGIADGAAPMLPLQLSNPRVSCFAFSRANRGWEGQNVAVREEGR